MKSIYETTVEARVDMLKHLADNPKSFYVNKLASGETKLGVFIDKAIDKEPTSRERVTFTLDEETDDIQAIDVVRSWESYIKKFGDNTSVYSSTMNAAKNGVELNMDVLDKMLDFESKVSRWHKILDNHLGTHWDGLKRELALAGLPSNSSSSHEHSLLNMAELSILLNTPDEGSPILTSAKHVANNILSTQGQVKILKVAPHLEEEVKQINRKMTPEYQAGLDM